jgi:hypothetical protein
VILQLKAFSTAKTTITAVWSDISGGFGDYFGRFVAGGDELTVRRPEKQASFDWSADGRFPTRVR